MYYNWNMCKWRSSCFVCSDGMVILCVLRGVCCSTLGYVMCVAGCVLQYSGLGFLDDTSVNAIRLFCQTAAGVLTNVVMSSEGSYGQWKGMYSLSFSFTHILFLSLFSLLHWVFSYYVISLLSSLSLGMRSCPLGEFLMGVRANVVPDQGTLGDDLGMDNLQMRCSKGNVLDGLYGTPAKEDQVC